MRDVAVNTKIIKDAVTLACRAPSMHNSQPWRWVAAGRTVELFVDPNRAPRHADTSGREALISCGAVLDHFRVAMAAAGWTTNVDRFPNPNDLHHLASVDFSPLDFVTDGHRHRADAILLRRTDRLPFAAPPDWESVEPRLRSSVNAELVRVDVVPDDLRPELAEASALTESLRLYDSSYHSELEWWTSDFSGREGIPHSSLVSAAESDRVDVGRTFPVTHHRERRREVGDDHSKIMVLSTYDDTHDAMLQCGEMLSAVLLDATLAGLATCTLTHITELPASRQIVATLIGQSTTPQVLIRIGLVPSLDDVPPATPRRPINEVFEVR
ncbi:NAD(P)H nitroreductase [Mycobacterium sp. 155]|uniref:Acg family FMN-binding oxidoreductase n=1 Tax=Mycobacterium sp. 155 TaxID=1157943 RepID=UPI0003A1D19D|nr:NAD(P)H nitroreductase [Mycobacterium sp. 155]